MTLELKLRVPWEGDLLPVDYDNQGVIRVIKDRDSDNPNVCTHGNDVRVVDFFEECNRVPDVSRYRIHNMGCCPRYDDRYRISNDRYIIPRCDISGEELERQLQRPQPRPQPRQEQIGNIVLLLESPHKDEYIGGDITRPKAPGCGSTGDNIDRWLGTVLSRIEEQQLIEPGCHVIISNPIQFQTSLHAIHNNMKVERDGVKYSWNTLKDNIWRTLWEQEDIKQCFRERLNTYRPSLIINGCTGKRTESDSLTAHVEEVVCTELQNVAEFANVPLYDVGHPVSWTNFRRIRLEPIDCEAQQIADNPQQ